MRLEICGTPKIAANFTSLLPILCFSTFYFSPPDAVPSRPRPYASPVFDITVRTNRSVRYACGRERECVSEIGSRHCAVNRNIPGNEGPFRQPFPYVYLGRAAVISISSSLCFRTYDYSPTYAIFPSSSFSFLTLRRRSAQGK